MVGGATKGIEGDDWLFIVVATGQVDLTQDPNPLDPAKNSEMWDVFPISLEEVQLLALGMLPQCLFQSERGGALLVMLCPTDPTQRAICC